jgi:hypothetical protein
MQKTCARHGNTEHFLQIEGGRDRWRCRACNAEGVSRHRNAKKAWCIAKLGGKCMRCGYSRCVSALEFHHREPGNKDFQFSKYQKASYETLAAELEKCDLLCANCHREVHAELDRKVTNKSARSSAEKSAGFRSRESQVRILPSAPECGSSLWPAGLSQRPGQSAKANKPAPQGVKARRPAD